MRIIACGFPHSDICGSMDMCSSPQLFAAYHVLLRLPVPRHPPDALVNLTICFAYFAHRFVSANSLGARLHGVVLASRSFAFLALYRNLLAVSCPYQR